MADNRTMEELLQAPTEGDVPNDVIKLMMFSYSLEGNTRVWYDKKPPNSILTWKNLVNKFMNQFFPPSKTTHLKNEISHFTQRFEETFREACERFKEMLRACPHHGFTELAQIDTFYNGLNDNDQDSLNAANVVTLAPVKAVEESCVTCGGTHAYYNCPNTDRNQPSVATGTYNQVAPQNRENNYIAPPVPNQGFQTQPFQVPNNPVQQGFPNEFLSYKKVNDQMMRNMQNQINSLKREFKNEIQNTMKTQQTVLMKQQNAFQKNLQNMLRRSFLRTGRALIDIYGEEITLRVNEEAVTFNLNQTTRYSSIYDDLSVNRIDIIDVAIEEYAQKILCFSNNSSGGNLTLTFEPILFDPSLFLTPFEGSDFILE
nr:reverse transcriptase domain-containing protein [Tanacetum cinerariifolium]